MTAYTPHDPVVFALIHAILALELALGFAITRLHSRRLARLLAWVMLVGFTVGLERLAAEEPPGIRMIFLILPVLFGMKSAVCVESGTRLPFLCWLGFCLLWFGMRPHLFKTAGGPALSGARELFVKGLIRFACGIGLVALAWGVWQLRDQLGDVNFTRWLATVPLAIGLSLLLHFGYFNMLAGCWRWFGVDCRTLWKAPALATNLNDFWSKRWNLAFSEMTSLAVYRPASAVTGRKAALAAAFIFSGLVHELAISVPVYAGYGRPTLYFLLHGGLILIENALARRGFPIDRIPWLGRVWTMSAVVLPLPILFHPRFLAGCIWPLIGMEPTNP